MAEKDEELSKLKAWLSLQKREHKKLNKAYGKKVKELKMSLAQSTKECEALQNMSKKLETDREDLELSISEKERSLNSLEESLCLHKREREREADGKKKTRELQMSLVRSTQECEALQNKSRKLEKEREDLELSIAEKEESLLIEREEDNKQAREMASRFEKK